ncbi:MAG TPA: chloramphenicol phosphotransferase CPT [Acetobacteraceae bacterium]|nr:chloramphenicol phosphotransferase CPT [Acetobacteraceae bacterium]
MLIHVIVLNGGSSSGKSSIVRALQDSLPQPWLTFGVDDFVDAIPPAMQNSEDGLVFLPDGRIAVGPGIRRLGAAWEQGIAAIARAGVGVIIDEVFLAGATAQERWRAALHGLKVLWVGVRCDPLVASQREKRRGDRVPGMAAQQADVVHQGVTYDLVIDSTNATPSACAQMIVDRLATMGIT